MAEQRLIDANNLGVGKANPDAFERKEYAYGWNNALQAVTYGAPTIDPETLPIVRQLREELARVTAERDAAIKDLYMTKDCNTCALQFTDECLLEDCMEPCCNFWRGYVPYKWRGLQKEEP